ncbi:MAG: ribonuclease H [Patescibacteria group bacterium]
MIKQDKVIIYTDGAAKGNPGRAGWAAVILLSQNSGEPRVLEIGGGVEHATNNQMELTAPIKALKHIKNKFTNIKHIEIISDSKYVILGITEWIFNWQKNNWRNANKKPVLNRELWEELYGLTQELKPKWMYVKGHNEDKWNDRADLIATSFAEEDPVELRNKKEK